MGLHENLLKSIYAYGLEKPSQIQQRCIVPFCKGLDVIQRVEFGPEKTVIFCVGILQQLDYSLRQCQALVLAPKREVALQIVKILEGLGEDLGVKVCVSIGPIGSNKPAGVHVAVGTPGRIFDLVRRQLRRDCIKMVVLDEADEILERGFKEQIHDMFQSMTTRVQVGIFSATVPADLLEIARKFMNKPVSFLVNS
ncbi:hypothetical protein ACS0TY_012646 [Phlomoides rotata]